MLVPFIPRGKGVRLKGNVPALGVRTVRVFKPHSEIGLVGDPSSFKALKGGCSITASGSCLAVGNIFVGGRGLRDGGNGFRFSANRSLVDFKCCSCAVFGGCGLRFGGRGRGGGKGGG